jgi:hypothetical protein
MPMSKGGIKIKESFHLEEEEEEMKRLIKDKREETEGER